MPPRIQYATLYLLFIGGAYLFSYTRVALCLLVLQYFTETVFHTRLDFTIYNLYSKGYRSKRIFFLPATFFQILFDFVILHYFFAVLLSLIFSYFPFLQSKQFFCPTTVKNPLEILFLGPEKWCVAKGCVFQGLTVSYNLNVNVETRVLFLSILRYRSVG